jgi:hypothetical protein
MNRHNSAYTVLLVVHAFLMLSSAATVLFFLEPFNGRNGLMLYCLSCGAMTGIVLALRLGKFRYARIATRVANVLYLPQFFIGTALGIYGLLMVDRQKKTADVGRG